VTRALRVGAPRRRAVRRVRANGTRLTETEATLLDLVDHALNRGIVLDGELVLGLAGVDLVYVRAALLLCAADRVLGPRSR